jgi:hypothetical protein
MAQLLDDPAVHPDLAALPSAPNLIPPDKMRSKLFLRTFLLPIAPLWKFPPARRADCLTIFTPERLTLPENRLSLG